MSAPAATRVAVPDAGEAAHAALALLACAPAALGGALVVGGGLECERWLAALRAARGGAPWRRVPTGITDDRLLGGLDVAATLASGTRTLARGLLAEADGGTLALPRAADAAPNVVAVLARALDDGAVRLERDGLSAVHDAAVCVVAAAGAEEREQLSPTLLERLALHVTLPDGYEPPAPANDAAPRAPDDLAPTRAHVAALAEAAEALGVDSPRALLLAVRAARAAAAAAGRVTLAGDDLAWAVQLVLAPRATRLPPAPTPPDAPAPDDGEAAPEQPADTESSADAEQESGGAPPAELLIEAARAALPPALLDGTARATRAPAPRAGSGRRGAEQRDDARGRRVGTRQGHPRRGARLDLVETLRAAAPWQRVRVTGATPDAARDGLEIRGEDLRVQRRVRRTGTTTLFLVDASGSAALGRLAEAKGAVELLLAESYVRRDRVGLVAFKGTDAELLLPPTRALSRARRALAALPAGGGTPLAAALLRAATVVHQVTREGGRSAVVLLTDGRANVARDGTPGRARAREDAHAAARALRGLGGLVVLVDTSPRGDPDARALAATLDARYVALPVVTARALHDRVRALVADDSAARGAS
jgi:magnesium chelatase subunit D